MPIWETFKKIIERYDMIAPGDKVLASVSGGPDSIALLHLLLRRRKQVSFDLAAVHYHHGLRGTAADNDQKFVEKTCARWGVPCISVSLPVKKTSRSRQIGLEEAGRDLRYKGYSSLAHMHGFTKIALGHHRDDQAETLLFRILRGTGPRGLGGIPPVRPLSEVPALIIRPLLFVARKEIESFLRKNHIAWRRDLSNTNTRFARNRIRLQLLPVLKKYNPCINEHLGSLAESFYWDNDYWYTEIQKAVKQIIIKKKSPSPRPLPGGERGGEGGNNTANTLDLKKFNKYHITIRLRILQWLMPASIDGVTLRRITQICAMSSGIKRIEVPGFGVIEKSQNVLRMLPRLGRPVKSPSHAAVQMRIPGKTRIQGSGLTVAGRILDHRPRSLKSGRTRAFFDADKLAGKLLCVRTRKPGDRFFPFGSGGSQKLKDFFINTKVDVYERNTIPLLCTGRGNNEIMWVVGHRTDDRWKVSGDTKHILEITVEKQTMA